MNLPMQILKNEKDPSGPYVGPNRSLFINAARMPIDRRTILQKRK